ncbi:hypothetical protein BDF20DRAFT_974609 [Mycotypha africana]|uniref:uncharacterized protein n=1 Tax=Mycotypha africana TaxID=64632 RepID=UPI002300DC9B|nr:uncharacterized protein BDF20DRAFT_974609 [Mycotypha africana]KAI8979551.1 hypothetical protein BDF20DRAFT_974609 [Mycotypha africana]
MADVQIPKKPVKALKLRLQNVKKHLDPILSRPLNETYSKLSLTERYELEVLLSYSLNTLYYIYLRTKGSDPQNHAVMTELKRVQSYVLKLQKLQGKGPKPSMTLDKDAAARFIKASLANNDE